MNITKGIFCLMDTSLIRLPGPVYVLILLLFYKILFYLKERSEKIFVMENDLHQTKKGSKLLNEQMHTNLLSGCRTDMIRCWTRMAAVLAKDKSSCLLLPGQ